MKVYLTAIIIIVLLVAAGSLYFYKFWLPTKQLNIQLGLASDKFPWLDYSQAELDKMYPQIKYADVPTRVTPEETYAKFREALKTNNLELALAQLSSESKNYEENKKAIEKTHEEGKFKILYNEYLEKLEKNYMYEAMAQYYFLEKTGDKTTSYPIDFLKDASGDWKMDSL